MKVCAINLKHGLEDRAIIVVKQNETRNCAIFCTYMWWLADQSNSLTDSLPIISKRHPYFGNKFFSGKHLRFFEKRYSGHRNSRLTLDRTFDCPLRGNNIVIEFSSVEKIDCGLLAEPPLGLSGTWKMSAYEQHIRCSHSIKRGSLS